MAPKNCAIAGCSVLADVKLESKAVATCCLETDAVDLCPNSVFKLLANPSHHSCLFESINRVEHKIVGGALKLYGWKVESELKHDDGNGLTRWHVDYHAQWKFWKLGGVLKVAIVMDTDEAKRTVSFKLREPGFLNVFEGLWSVSAPSSSNPVGVGGGRRISFLRPSWSSASSVATSSLPVAHISSISDRLGHISPTMSLNQVALSTSLPTGDGLGAMVPTEHRALSTCSGDQDVGGSSGLGEEMSGDDSDWQPTPLSRKSSSLGSDVSKMSGTEGLAQMPVSASNALFDGARPLSIVRFQQRMGPSVAPPFPLNQLLKGQLMGQARQMMEGLLMKARAMECS